MTPAALALRGVIRTALAVAFFLTPYALANLIGAS